MRSTIPKSPDQEHNGRVRILVLGFNRGYLTFQLLRNLSVMSTLPITLVLDGARNVNDEFQQHRLIERLRMEGMSLDILKGNTNQGCARGVVSGINATMKFFRPEILIIIEDDCWPKQEFLNDILNNQDHLRTDWLTFGGQLDYSFKGEETLIASKYLLIHGWAISRWKWESLIQRAGCPGEWPLKKKISWQTKLFFSRNINKVNRKQLDTWDSHLMRASWTFAEPNFYNSIAGIVNLGFESSRDPNGRWEQNPKKYRSFGTTDPENVNEFIEKTIFGFSTFRPIRWLVMTLLHGFLSIVRKSDKSFEKFLRDDLEKISETNFRMFLNQ